MKVLNFVFVFMILLVVSSCEEQTGIVPDVEIDETTIEVFSNDFDWEKNVSLVSETSIDGYSVRVNTENVNIDELGEYDITVEVIFDGEVVKEEIFTVSIVDTTGPQISIDVQGSLDIEIYHDFEEPTITYSDNYDDDLSITTVGEVNTGILGEYQVTYMAEDTSGNKSEVILLVNVVDTTPPVLSIIGDEVVYIGLGNYYVDEGYTVSDNYDSMVDVQVANSVDFFQGGEYFIEYSAVDDNGNMKSVIRTVVIFEHEETYDEEEYFKVYQEDGYYISINKMIETSNNLYVGIGGKTSKGNVMAFNEYGLLLWQTSFGDDSKGYLRPNGIIEADGFIYAVGTFYNNADSRREGFIIKLNMDGEIIEEQYDTRYSDVEYNNIFVDNDGYLILTGRRSDLPLGQVGQENYTFEMSKLTTSLDIVWRSASGPEGQMYFGLSHIDESYFLIGHYDRYGSRVFRLNISEDGIYENTEYIFNGISGHYAEMIDSMGNIVIAYSYDTLANQGLTKIGDIENKEVSFENLGVIVQVTQIIETPSGNFLVVGSAKEEGQVNRGNVIIIEYTNDLEYVSHEMFLGNYIDFARGAFITSTNKIIVYGTISSNANDFKDYNNGAKAFLLKMNEPISDFFKRDTEKPQLVLNGDSVIYIIRNQEYIDANVIATDNYTEKPNVTMYNNVDTSKDGLYTVYYVAEDEANNKSILRRTVIVVDVLPEDLKVLDLATINFKEPYLYEQIISEDRNDDGYLSESELERINYLVFVHGPINNPDILSSFEHLTGLYISNQELKDISFVQDLVNLEYLNLSHNIIEDITPLANLTNLIDLNLGFNNISDVSSINGLDQLINLIMPYNQITDVSTIGPLPMLEELVLYSNNITNFDSITDYPNLVSLNLTSNNLSSINGIGELVHLQYLYIHNNNLTSISEFSSLVDLINLTINDNNIDDVCSLSSMINLTNLNFRDNNISDISCLNQLINLKGLHMINNPVEDISVVANFTYLEMFDMNAELITDISVFQDLEYLTSVGLRGIIITPEIQEVMDELIDRGIEVYN